MEPLFSHLLVQAVVNMKRVLLVTNIPTPYRIPLFNELHRQMNENGLQLRVVFAEKGYRRRKWKIDLRDCCFDYVILGSGKVSWMGKEEQTQFFYSGLLKAVRAYSPDVLIVPGFSLATSFAWLLSLLNRKSYLIWTGSVWLDGTVDSKWRLWQRKMLAKRAAGAIAYGSRAKLYLQTLGMPEQSIHIAINTVDTSFFSTQTAVYKAEIPCNDAEQHQLLYIGHVTQRKRLDQLFRVVEYLAKMRSDFCLKIVGSGPEEDALRRLAVELKIDRFVHFEGYRQLDELPGYLAQAACFLFPSGYDIWGLVLNEAMAAGVPCFASLQAGATYDLIQEGKTGFAVDFSDTEYVARKIHWLLDHPDEAAEIGQQARQFVMKHASLQESAAGFVKAVKQVSNGWQTEEIDRELS